MSDNRTPTESDMDYFAASLGESIRIELRNDRLRIATAFLVEIAWGQSEGHFREQSKLALRWADILIEEASK